MFDTSILKFELMFQLYSVNVISDTELRKNKDELFKIQFETHFCLIILVNRKDPTKQYFSCKNKPYDR